MEFRRLFGLKMKDMAGGWDIIHTLQQTPVASSYKYDNEPSKIFISWGVMQCSPLKVN
jgi:hypothetical protein